MNTSTFSNYKHKFNQHLYKHWQNRSIHLLKLTKVKSSGLEKISIKGPAVIAPNHISWKDILFLIAMIKRPISFAATFKLFDKNLCHKLLDQYFEKFAHHQFVQKAIYQINEVLAKFLVDRVTNGGVFPAKMDLHGRNFIEAAKNVLRQSKLVCVFPEGGLGTPDKLRRFKLGVPKVLYEYYLDHRRSIPTFPIGITGTQRFYYPGMKLGFHVGSPLYIEDYIQSSERQTLLTFTQELQQAVHKLLNS